MAMATAECARMHALLPLAMLLLLLLMAAMAAMAQDHPCTRHTARWSTAPQHTPTDKQVRLLGRGVPAALRAAVGGTMLLWPTQCFVRGRARSGGAPPLWHADRGR